MRPLEPTAAVIGGTGFIGSAVTAEYRRRGAGARVIARRSLGRPGVIELDAADRSALVRAISGVSSVVHAASYVGRDPALSHAANVEVTRALVAASKESGIESIVYVSTTGVYGMGPFRGVLPGDTPVAPASAASSDRLKAEQIILDAGGLVVRPHLVYGAGDRWVVPSLVKVAQMSSGMAVVSDSLSSVISVELLASLVVDLATVPAFASQPKRIWHGTHPRPIRLSQLSSSALLALGFPPLAVADRDPGSEDLRDALTRLGLSAHQVDLVMVDHWYASNDVWSMATSRPLARPFTLSSEHVSWYRSIFG